MRHFVGLDVSVEETAVCVVDEPGRVVARAAVESGPAAIAARLLGRGIRYGRVGLEAGPMSPRLHAGLVEAGPPAVRVETRHMRAAPSARIDKTDRNDARGIARMMRVGLFEAVHAKTPAGRRRRLLPTSRKLLRREARDLENDLRGGPRDFGPKVGVAGAAGFGRRVREPAAGEPFVAAVVGPLLEARATLRLQLARLHKMPLDPVRDDPVCRRPTTAPGVGPVAAPTCRARVDDPGRFDRSKRVGAHHGLTPRSHRSGETARVGRVSRRGDAMPRASLFEAGLVPLTSPRIRWSPLEAWGMAVAKRRGMRKAVVAVARKPAVVLRRMWRDEVDFRWPKTA